MKPVPSQGVKSMRKLVVPLAVVIAFAAFAATSRADMVLEQTNSVGQTFNGTSGTKTVNFDPGLFPADPSILDIEVEISFTKLAASAGTSPKYNEISFSLSKAEVPGVNLISFGSAAFPFTGSFSPGFIGDGGFNGTLIFKQSAATAVNSNPNLITAGTFMPAATNADGSARANASLAPFIGVSGSGTYTLSIGDSANTGDPGLVFNSFTVRITAVPEPTSLAFLGLFATAGAFVRRRRVR